MKNIHILPTEKPSRLVKQKYDTIDRLCLADMATKRVEYKRFNLYITNDAEIKAGDWVLLPKYTVYPYNNIKKMSHSDILDYLDSQSLATKKIILTTDQDLIKDGVQAIPDEFLEWFVKNPSCEFVKIKNKILKVPNRFNDDYRAIPYFKIIIPKEEPKQDALNHFLSTSSVIVKDPQISNFNKQETLEEAGKEYTPKFNRLTKKEIFEAGAKWQQERSYSEEEVLKLILTSSKLPFANDEERIDWFEQFKKK